MNLDNIMSWNMMWSHLTFGFSQMPYTISTSFFRLSSIIVMLCYLNEYAFIPIIVFWLSNILILIKYPTPNTTGSNENSIWLMSFIGIFVPSYFFPSYGGQNYTHVACHYERVCKVFKIQSFLAMVCYIPAIIACYVIVNKPCDFKYALENSENALNNFEFNIIAITIVSEGVISTFLSFFTKVKRPVGKFFKDRIRGSADIKGAETKPTTLTRSIQVDEHSRFDQYRAKGAAYRSRQLPIVKTCMMMFSFVLCILPIIMCPYLICFVQKPEVKGYVHLTSNSDILECFLSNANDQQLEYMKGGGKISGYLSLVSEKHSDPMIDSNTIIVISICTFLKMTKQDIDSYKQAKAILILEDVAQNQQRLSSPLPPKAIQILNEGIHPIMFAIRNVTSTYPLIGENGKLIDSTHGACISLTKTFTMRNDFNRIGSKCICNKAQCY